MTLTISLRHVRIRALSLAAAIVLAFSIGCADTEKSSLDNETPQANTEARLDVSGAIPNQGSLTIADLETLGPVTFSWEHDGVTYRVRGVAVEKVLRRYGWDIGPGGKDVLPKDRRNGWRRVVCAVAADGYRTAFSTAEVTDELGPTHAFVVWEEDGHALAKDLGPLRLLVPSDKKGARAVRQLVALHVVDLGEAK